MADAPRKLSHYFTHSKRKGRAGLPLMSVTMHDGLVRRDSLDRKTDSALKDEEHLLVEPGDIAYNMMRMWQGALGLADEAANVSPAYGVMRPKNTVDPRFAKHWFKSDRGLYMLWAFSYGLTEDRLRLYPAEFLEIPVSWPEFLDQIQTADALDQIERLILLSHRLAGAKGRRYRALIQRLSSNHAGARTELGDFVARSSQKASVDSAPTSIELDNVEGQSGRLIGATPTKELQGARATFQTADILYCKLRPYLNKFHYADRPGLASTEFWVLRADRDVCEQRFLFHLIQTHEFAAEANRPTGSRMPRADWEVVQGAPLPLPSKDEQANLLLPLDAAHSDWLAEIRRGELLQIKKRSLMQRLLPDTGDERASISRREEKGEALDR
ncbi:restriction endonuclease subunit S [Erythrobacter sp. SD-21]|uniref:restriction endonuclease subunit S n=1 Tax=Erythrobacter sp. SD-21 TaxID=161528 RepID=UPI0003100A11|nr:restriction endonuclease subunit S [Erythrobacter sp. SD-21]